MLLPHSATVIDGMVIVQKVNGNKTLRAILNPMLAIALAEAEGSVRIDIVFDVYKDVSIKNAEWQSRSNSVEAIVYKTLFPSQVVPQWDSFKANPVNKANLIRFIASEWRKENSLCRTKLGERNTVIIITCDEDCFKIMSNTVELVPEQVLTRRSRYPHDAASDPHIPVRFLLCSHCQHWCRSDFLVSY